MKTDDKADWRPRRFDVAGAHPDEVYRAVAEVASAVDEIGKQFQRFTGMYRDVQTWRQNKPLRFGRNLDADVQQFLAQGVRIMDDFNEEMPLGLSDSHRQVRNRCNELARGMEKVLAKRPEEVQFRFRRAPSERSPPRAATPAAANRATSPGRPGATGCDES